MRNTLVTTLLFVLSFSARAEFEKGISVYDLGSYYQHAKFEQDTSTEAGRIQIKNYFLRNQKKRDQGQTVTGFLNSVETKDKIEDLKTYASDLIAGSLHFKDSPAKVEAMTKKLDSIRLNVNFMDLYGSEKVSVHLQTPFGIGKRISILESVDETPEAPVYTVLTKKNLDDLLESILTKVRADLDKEVQEYDKAEARRIQREQAASARRAERERVAEEFQMSEFSNLELNINDSNRGSRKENNQDASPRRSRAQTAQDA